MTVEEAIIKFYEEAIDTVNGADYQFSNREELIIEICRGLTATKEELLKKC